MVRFGHKKCSVSVQKKIIFGIKYLVLVATNTVGHCPGAALKLFSGLTLTDIETQSPTAVTPPPSPPLPDIKVRM